MSDAVDEILTQWSAERPDLDTSVMGLVGRISRAAEHVAQRQRQTFTQHGLDTGAFDVLATLRRSGPPYELTPLQLTRSAMISSAATAQRLNRLEADGLVTRRTNPDDGRGVLVRLTGRGARIIDEALPDHLATEQQLVSALTPAQQDQLTRLLRRMLIALECRDGA